MSVEVLDLPLLPAGLIPLAQTVVEVAGTGGLPNVAYRTPLLTGPAGAAGIGYTTSVIVSGVLTLGRTDGTTVVVGNVVGPQGPAGSTGGPGPQGVQGPAGQPGPTQPATANTIGAVKPGVGFSVATDGTLSLASISLGLLAQGGASLGQVISWTGTAWAPAAPAVGGISYTLPVATTASLGGIRPDGTTLTVDSSGVARVVGGGASYSATAPITLFGGAIGIALGATANTVAAGNDPRFAAAEQSTNKGVANGYAGLDGSGKVPAAQLPAGSGSVTYTGAAPISVAGATISLSSSGASVGQLLGWNGTAWAPVTPAAGTSYTGSAPITVASGAIALSQSGATTGQVLTWNGSSWAPQSVAAGPSPSTALPLVDGVAAIGTASTFARADHVHPIDSSRLAATSNLSDLASVATARANLGLGAAATLAVGTAVNTVAAGNDSRIVGALQSSAIPAGAGLLGGSSTAGAAITIAVGPGLTLSSGTLSATAQASTPLAGISINGSTIAASTASPYQMQTADRVVDVNKTTGAATSITLPTAPTLWVEYTVIDGKGDAGTNNITITAPSGGTINGQSTFVIRDNFAAYSLRPVSSTTWRLC